MTTAVESQSTGRLVIETLPFAYQQFGPLPGVAWGATWAIAPRACWPTHRPVRQPNLAHQNVAVLAERVGATAAVGATHGVTSEGGATPQPSARP
jgi:hypothetical protein